MTIIAARRMSQIFFGGLFLWFCVVMEIGDAFWELRGWPVNWLLQLDPLVGLGSVLATGVLHQGLMWGLVTLTLTILFGRFFCGWICPFGTLHQVIGYSAHRRKSLSQKVRLNRYHPLQRLKYLFLFFFLGAATGSLQTGLLDPIPFLHRSVNLIVLPLLGTVGAGYYQSALSIGIPFLLSLGLNAMIPRFYCRFVCPLGALMGLAAFLSIWRMGKKTETCPDCMHCESLCEGACNPSGKFRVGECVLCMNCRPACEYALVAFQPAPSAAGEMPLPEVSRRQFGVALLTGVALIPIQRLGGSLGANWNPRKVRPPGALAEKAFLDRCIKCGQCMRICPTNVIQPSAWGSGLEDLWTPVLNFRIGTSGCQLNCIACGHVCPTGAIRPLALDRKLGRDEYRESGPIRIGLAFVDRGRCLPWAMNRPCIVCQENCPVSPKAIQTEEVYSRIADIPPLQVVSMEGSVLRVHGEELEDRRLGGGDYFCRVISSPAATPRPIMGNDAGSLTMGPDAPVMATLPTGGQVEILIRLQRPWVEPSRCIGCGICEHECPVAGERAIRITAENETREQEHSLLL
ncbi:MAG: 4Fe-4S binding protein [Thermodesulfobacteriota bacterium]